ncbi:tellurite resistance protein TehA-like permease [Kushneria sinocarnis]|uniref:Tellurite resistance protein TehA-like permease n=1 Tax=Kushneria sinocarnis TaxID=595502 RepID=A0A420WTS0_9GAMM|nr:tellurite resistance/C4-dicarboxylate transporter family protein [Kushneria sinocarnis]RKQ96890.1 tellurite resistance protein TehA-like permease [Kushneria sinocarnis]
MTDQDSGRDTGRWLRKMSPAWFTLAMATGTLSNAFWQLDMKTASGLFHALNGGIYPLLLVLLLARALCFPRAVYRDLLDPRQVFTFFTLVAASCVFGVEISYRGWMATATLLLIVAGVLWLVLGYVSFGVLAFRNDEQQADVTHGGWLLWIVATQSMVILATRLFQFDQGSSSLAALLLFGAWGFGVMWYAIFITIFFNRVSFLKLNERDINPVYWVVMGSAAISVEAGAQLLPALPRAPMWQSAAMLLEAAVMILWWWSSWLIPVLLMLDGWKHLVRREPLDFRPTVWASVFPVAMYALATGRLASTEHFGLLHELALGVGALASLAWLVSVVGLLVWLLKRRSRQKRSSA